MKKLVLLLLLVVALAGAVTVALRFRGTNAVDVNIETVRRRPRFESYVTASGEIVAARYADIGSSIMGRLVELRVKEGDPVRSGQVLAVIDSVPAQSDVDAQEAQIRTLEAEERVASEQVVSARSDMAAISAREREARTSLERIQKLAEAGVAPAAQLDSAKATLESLEAQKQAAESTIVRLQKSVEAARRRIGQAEAQSLRVRDALSKTRITASMDGIVSRLQVREGEMIVIGVQNQPGTTLMTISDLAALNAEIKVAEADVVQVRLGQTARIAFEALPGREFSGKVIEVGASALPVTGAAAAREFKVVVRLDRPESVLRPGLTCDAEVLVNERAGVLTVPLQAVVLRPGPEADREISGVFVVRDGRARFVSVETGIIGGLDIEVSGVEEDASIVTGPIQTLRDLKDGVEVVVKKP